MEEGKKDEQTDESGVDECVHFSSKYTYIYTQSHQEHIFPTGKQSRARR